MKTLLFKRLFSFTVAALAYIVLVAMFGSSISCTEPTTGQVVLCPGNDGGTAPAEPPSDLLPIAYTHALYMVSPGVEFEAVVLSIDDTGAADLAFTGGNPVTLTLGVAKHVRCVHFHAPAGLVRHDGHSWIYPSMDLAEAVDGLTAMGALPGMIRAAVPSDMGIQDAMVPMIPDMDASDYPAWIIDPRNRVGQEKADAYALACLF